MENEHFYKMLYYLGNGGIIIWIFSLGFFIYTKIQQKWFAKKIDLQWIKNHEKKSNYPISKLIINLKKTSQVFKKLRKFIKYSAVFFSLSFLMQFLLKNPYEKTILSGLLITAIHIPMWFNATLYITTVDNKRKKITEVMKKNNLF
jgi:hypothetical protein